MHRLVAYFCGALLVACCIIRAAEGTETPAGKISGMVSDTDRIPIAGAVVTLVAAADGRQIARAQTAFDGKYVIGAVAPGEYMLVGAKPGYPRHSMQSGGAFASRSSSESRRVRNSRRSISSSSAREESPAACVTRRASP